MSKYHFARQIFHLIDAVYPWYWPRPIRAHLNRIGYYNGVRRALNRHLPPINIWQVLGIQSLPSRVSSSSHSSKKSFHAFVCGACDRKSITIRFNE